MIRRVKNNFVNIPTNKGIRAMKKIQLQPNTFLYPMPLVIVGTMADDRPNFITIAYCGIVQHTPPMISIASSKVHFSNKWIKRNRSFSVNIPSSDMIELTDYIGMYSGRETDKSEICELFCGDIPSAPMIKQSPLSLQCKLMESIEVGGVNEIFIGEILKVYANEDCITNGLPDITKLQPILFSMHDNNYWGVGKHLGKAWNIGKNFNPNTKKDGQ